MDKELERVLYSDLKGYRFISYYFSFVGLLSLASPFLFKRAFSGIQWTTYCFILAALCLLSAYALLRFKRWAIYIAVGTLLISSLGKFHFNESATFSVFVLPAVLSMGLMHQHLKLLRILKSQA